ncbi:MAG: M3 family oligoendopeptidase [Clostridiales Family XIII bacterium]|jgi:M3 family oligoendopeptidase|nr:M3 family oligoendopeptidase [Clostridiales Family XIII bacterium]
MKFSEMEYTRIDVAEELARYLDFAAQIERAASFEEAEAAYLAYDKAAGHVDTLATLAMIRRQLDMDDAYYKKENLFCEQARVELGAGIQKVAEAVLSSAFRQRFADKYGEILLSKLSDTLDTSNPLITDELKEESRLGEEYDDLLQNAKALWDGKLLTQYELSDYKCSEDDEVRLRAWRASGEAYQQSGEALDRVYDDLVKLRTAAARKLGYENFIPLGYKRMQRDWFGPEDLPAFRAAVKELIVPLATQLTRDQAARTGMPWPMNFSENSLTFRSGLPKPVGTQEDTFRTGVEAFRQLSPETAEFIDFLTENELYDVSQRSSKSSGGFVAFLPDYRAPFLFSHFSGKVVDVNSLTHEGGHAFAGYMTRDIVPSLLRHPPMDTAEIHSQAMEFFLLPWAEDFFGDDALKFSVEQLTEVFTFIPYGVMVDEFQHIMYEQPEMSPGERHKVWSGLMADYTPWLKSGDIPFYGDGQHWQRQPHIYTAPFYYIDYVLSQIGALQFRAAALTDREDAWARYVTLVKVGGRENFLGLVKAAGFDSPLRRETLSQIAEGLGGWLAGVDLSSLA